MFTFAIPLVYAHGVFYAEAETRRRNRSRIDETAETAGKVGEKTFHFPAAASIVEPVDLPRQTVYLLVVLANLTDIARVDDFFLGPQQVEPLTQHGQGAPEVSRRALQRPVLRRQPRGVATVRSDVPLILVSAELARSVTLNMYSTLFAIV